jgi:hypothetical protein
MVIIDPQTAGKIADATTALAETGGKAIDAASGLGRIVKGPVDEIVGMLTDRLRLTRLQRRLIYADKVEAEMKRRGISAPTRDLPINFAVPLLAQAILEEDDDLQEMWARLLVNAGDAATEMELRTAYVDILKGMSAFDVLNLSKLAEAVIDDNEAVLIATGDLPHSASRFPGGSTINVSKEVLISLANLGRLGCIAPTSGYGGGISFSQVLVTELGLALYRACS